MQMLRYIISIQLTLMQMLRFTISLRTPLILIRHGLNLLGVLDYVRLGLIVMGK